MHHANAGIKASVYRTLQLQLVLALLAVVIYALALTWHEALAAAYGAVSAGVLSAWLAFSVYRLAQRAERNTAQGRQRKEVAQMTALMSVGVIPRLLFIVVAFWFGLWQLKLPPVATIVGFSVTYLGYLISFYNLKVKQ